MTQNFLILPVLAGGYATAKLISVFRNRRIVCLNQIRQETQTIQNFFSDVENVRGRNVEQLKLVIGNWTDEDDWDFGRLIYQWKRPGLRVRVGTQGQSVRTVEFLDPLNSSRFGKVITTILDEPFDFQSSARNNGN